MYVLLGTRRIRVLAAPKCKNVTATFLDRERQRKLQNKTFRLINTSVVLESGMRVPVKSAISFFAHADEKRKSVQDVSILCQQWCVHQLFIR